MVENFEGIHDMNNYKQQVEKDGGKDKWSFLNETKTEITYPTVVEPVLKETCIQEKTSGSSTTEVRDMTGIVSHLSTELDQYLEQRPVVTCDSQKDLVQDTFEQVIVKRNGKRRPPDIKKPIRKKLQGRERSECSSSEGELERMSSEESLDGDVILKDSGLLPTTVMDPPVSPFIVETPIGSIKDKVRALQSKVEEDKAESDIAYFGETAKIADTSDFDDRRVGTDREEPDLSGKSLDRMHLESVISKGGRLPDDIQISPDRRPSEDFSADIKAELEESPEYQLFKQASTVSKMSFQLEEPEDATLTDYSVTNPILISSPRIKTFFGEGVSPLEIKDDGVESPKHEEKDLVHESFHEVILRSSNVEDKTDINKKEDIQVSKVEVTELPENTVLEKPFQEVCIINSQQQQPVTARDMSGMLSLLSCDLDRVLKEKPVGMQRSPDEMVVHESYREVILIKGTERETLTCSSDYDMMSSKYTNVDMMGIDKKQSLQSGLQTSSSGDECPRSFPSEEDFKALSEETPFNSFDEQHISKSYILQRPKELENLNIVDFDDPAKHLFHPDSLEGSPHIEDRSSKTSPDSIEPSPTKESPCPDSLEESPSVSKETELMMPAKTVVHEIYVSQLGESLTYDKSLKSVECEHEDQKYNCGVIVKKTEIEDHKYLNSPKEITDGHICSDPKICDSENIHVLTRQDSIDNGDSEDDTTNKQFTPEEEMFKMAAKIKTFEEMEQESIMKGEKSVDVTLLSETDEDAKS
ncbi:ankyrin-2-like [Antennarius striatus]|uniref:ankyrin-2-like n=1 Tax=Antennarius striatus TaxID=241820 RepID=UPI0035B2B5BB